jgi:hypothetical protein
LPILTVVTQSSATAAAARLNNAASPGNCGHDAAYLGFLHRSLFVAPRSNNELAIPVVPETFTERFATSGEPLELTSALYIVIRFSLSPYPYLGVC